MSDCTPTLQQLLKALQQLDKWFVLGVMLGVPVSQLKKIESLYSQRELERCKIDMLHYWLNSKLVPKWNDVILALKEIDQFALAAQIKHNYLSSTTDSEEEGVSKPTATATQLPTATATQLPTATATQLPTAAAGVSKDLYRRTLTVNDLCDVLAVIHGLDDWKQLGLQLGLLYPTLKMIDLNQRGRISGCKIDMLSAWLQQQDNVTRKGVPSWSVLRAALRSMGEHETADRISN